MGIPVIPNLTSSSAADPITTLDGQNGGTGTFIVGGSGKIAAAGPEGLNTVSAALNQVDTNSLIMIGAGVFILMMLMRGRR